VTRIRQRKIGEIGSDLGWGGGAIDAAAAERLLDPATIALIKGSVA
jgi:hypothetical protein